ncbi:MAG: hypothetical protein KKA07_04605, partial [Bacteroidetes bacterium]|nr:hypothetical protein [Bacteroidota bacterium]
YVGLGELEVVDFVSTSKIARISEHYFKFHHQPLTEMKSALGDEFSYADLRFVLKHLERLTRVKSAE